MAALVPLRVEFSIGSDIVLTNDQPIHLDGLLAWAHGQELESQGHPDPWAGALDLADCLERCHDDPASPVWCASQVMLNFTGDMDWRAMIRKADPEAMAEYRTEGPLDMRANVVNVNSGPLRAYMLNIPLRHARTAVAWCLGDPSAIQRRLNLVRHLGKMGRNGHGRVTGVTLTEDAVAERMWRYRTLPAGVPGVPGVRYGLTMETTTSPYWSRALMPARSPIEAAPVC